MEKTIQIPFTINEDLVEDTLETAFCGGINYWCNLVNAKDMDMKGQNYLSRVITNGGTLVLTDGEDEVEYELDFNKFCTGFERYINWCLNKKRNYALSSGEIDAVEADIIIQLSIFGDVIYS